MSIMRYQPNIVKTVQQEQIKKYLRLLRKYEDKAKEITDEAFFDIIEIVTDIEPDINDNFQGISVFSSTDDFNRFQFLHNSKLIIHRETQHLIQEFKVNPEIIFEKQLPNNYFQLSLDNVILVYKIVYKKRISDVVEYRYMLLGHILKRNLETRLQILDLLSKENF